MLDKCTELTGQIIRAKKGECLASLSLVNRSFDEIEKEDVVVGSVLMNPLTLKTQYEKNTSEFIEHSDICNDKQIFFNEHCWGHLFITPDILCHQSIPKGVAYLAPRLGSTSAFMPERCSVTIINYWEENEKSVNRSKLENDKKCAWEEFGMAIFLPKNFVKIIF